MFKTVYQIFQPGHIANHHSDNNNSALSEQIRSERTRADDLAER